MAVLRQLLHNDRVIQTGRQPVGVYQSTVDREFNDHYEPQDFGNHADTRWATLSDGRAGLLVAGDLDVRGVAVRRPGPGAVPVRAQEERRLDHLHAAHRVPEVSARKATTTLTEDFTASTSATAGPARTPDHRGHVRSDSADVPGHRRG